MIFNLYSVQKIIAQAVWYPEDYLPSKLDNISKLLLYFSNATVTLKDHNNIEANVLGIDDFGYLQVQTRDGEVISLQPDGNSFDMMTNMISIKTSR